MTLRFGVLLVWNGEQISFSYLSADLSLALFQYKDCFSRYENFHYKYMYKTVSYLYNGNPYAGKISSIYTCNKPISQIPQCIRQISHNAPSCNRNVHTFLLQNGTLWYVGLVHYE